VGSRRSCRSACLLLLEEKASLGRLFLQVQLVQAPALKQPGVEDAIWAASRSAAWPCLLSVKGKPVSYAHLAVEQEIESRFHSVVASRGGPWRASNRGSPRWKGSPQLT